MTEHLYPVETPIDLPKLGSWPEAVHVFDEASVFALEAAEAAGRPLLVRGDPGVGKSQLARAAAVARQRLFLSVVVHAQTTSQDLQWQFDAVSRLGEAQLLAQTQPSEAAERLHPRRFLSPGPLWWAFDWASAEQQWRTCAAPPEPMPLRPAQWRPGQGSVLLIDEIDKADSDLPNGLLETLGNGDFTAPYVGGRCGSSRMPRRWLSSPRMRSASCLMHFCAAVWCCRWACRAMTTSCWICSASAAPCISGRSAMRQCAAPPPIWCCATARTLWRRDRCRRVRRSISTCCAPSAAWRRMKRPNSTCSTRSANLSSTNPPHGEPYAVETHRPEPRRFDRLPLCV